jgi:hypothetical protein
VQGRIEKILNIGIGVSLLTNLYLLTGITRIPYLYFIGFSLLVSIFYTIKNFDFRSMQLLTNNWIVLCYFFFSLFLFVIDFFVNNSKPMPNDLVRVFMYAFYFNWTFLLYNNKAQINAWLVKVSLFSIIILSIEGIFELIEPFGFSLLLSSNVDKRNLGRIGGSLIDANTYACSLLIFLLVIFWAKYQNSTTYKRFGLFLLAGLVVYLADASGSRQGMVILFMFGIAKLIEHVSLKKIMWFFSALIGISLIFFLFKNDISSYLETNNSSSIARTLNNASNPKSAQSNIDRGNSILEAFEFMEGNYFLYGPGSLNFSSRWSHETDAYEPHNGIVYLLAQYAILSLPIFYLFSLSFFRARSARVKLMYFSVFVHFFFQPNAMYYALIFFVFFYIDVAWWYHERSEVESQELNNLTQIAPVH